MSDEMNARIARAMGDGCKRSVDFGDGIVLCGPKYGAGQPRSEAKCTRCPDLLPPDYPCDPVAADRLLRWEIGESLQVSFSRMANGVIACALTNVDCEIIREGPNWKAALANAADVRLKEEGK